VDEGISMAMGGWGHRLMWGHDYTVRNRVWMGVFHDLIEWGWWCLAKREVGSILMEGCSSKAC